MLKIHEEFLELMGFEKEEIPDVIQNWIYSCKTLNLSEEDLIFATREWIPNYWNTSLKGVRKCMNAYIRELIALTNIRKHSNNDEKVIYGILPSVPTGYHAMKYSGGDNVYVGFPDFHLVTVLNSFFNKAHSYIEVAEENGMTSGCRHCGLNKTRFGARYMNVIPSPDVIWSWGYTCDEAPKTDEFINCYMDSKWKYIVTCIPHDTCIEDIDDEIPERVEYIGEQIRDSMRNIEKITGIKITEENVARAINDTNRYALKIKKLTDLVNSADPQPLTGNELSLFSQPLYIPFNSAFKYTEEALDIVIEEVKVMINNGEGVLTKGSPKVGCYFVPFNVPWIDKMFGDNGINLSFSTLMSIDKKQLEPTKQKNLYNVIGEQWLRRAIGSNFKNEARISCELIKEYKPDAMLFGFFSFDRWMGAHQKMMVNMVEEATNITHFYIEGDFWDDRSYKQEDLKSRIETISNYLKMSKLFVD